MVNNELVAALCTALTFACALQIIISCFLSFAFSHYLSVLHITLATAAGVISGLVTVPTVIQLRAAQVSSSVGLKYGYTVWYKRLAIGMCLILQIITWIYTLVDIFTPYDENLFTHMMKTYIQKQRSKRVIDNVQWFLQCCGIEKYKDWYSLNWGGFVFDALPTRGKKSIKQLLYGNTDEYPDLTAIRNDAVPFSCCAVASKYACIHQNLEQLGASTININGCKDKLASTKLYVLLFEFSIYTVCLLIEFVILGLLRNSANISTTSNMSAAEKSQGKIFHRDEKQVFSNFINEIESDTISEDISIPSERTSRKSKSGSFVNVKKGTSVSSVD